MSLGGIRPQAERLPAACLSLYRPAEGIQHGAEVVVSLGILRPEL
jgi:hypothetical protein